MEPKTKSALQLALDQYEKDIVRALTRNVVSAHRTGDIEAQKLVGIRDINFKVINQSAVDYGKVYSDQLIKKGGSTINGKFVPWMKDLAEGQRKDVAAIITRGIEDGKSPGVKERKKGGYTKGTVAEELSVYFKGKKSRASMIARTEMGTIQSVGKLQRWKDLGYTHVKVIDGTDDLECRAANGQTWTIEKAMRNIKAHPNCIRNFIPINPYA